MRRLLGSVASVAVLSLSTTAGAAGHGGWSIQRTPSPPGATRSYFLGVSCTHSGDCEAVGVSGANGGSSLVERWEGKRWTIQPTPSATSTILYGVSCITSDACIAAGGQQSAFAELTLVERWDGKRWAIQPTPNPPNVPSSELFAVSCSRVNACFAAGEYQPTIIIPHTPPSNRPLMERLDGRRWKIEPTPAPPGAQAGFSAVSCTAPNACTAVGFGGRAKVGGALAERWDGKHWKIQSTPSGSVTDFAGVSCPSRHACTAVGTQRTSTGAVKTLAARWNGSRWEVQPTPNPTHATDSELRAVSCPTERDCTAVGFSNALLLVERWNGRRWTIQPAPNPPSPPNVVGNSLYSVSCRSAGACTAVGSYVTDPRLDNKVTLAEGYSRSRK